MTKNKLALKLMTIAFVLCAIALWIGPLKLELNGVPITIAALIWAVLFSVAITPSLLGKIIPGLKKIIGDEEIAFAPKMLSITLFPLAIMFGISAGPKIGIVLNAGPALLLQELGNLGTMLIALPFAMFIGLGRTSVGATYTLCRDTGLSIITDKYGLESDEGIGTLGVYIVGSVLGTVLYSLLAPLGLLVGFHPFALAMGSGMGSASMMSVATASLAANVDPSLVEQVKVFASTSGLLTAIDGVFFELFVALPLANKYYKFLDRPIQKISKWHKLYVSKKEPINQSEGQNDR